jgi:anti-sigma factor RsiW
MSKPLLHEEALELLPWFVNGTLAGAEHAAVEQHVRSCLPCRAALQEQLQLQTLIKQQPTVRLSPDAGFADLMRQVDDSAHSRFGPGFRQWHRSLANAFVPWTRRAVTIAVLIAGLALTSWLLTSRYSNPEQGPYATSSDSTSGSAALIDIVFADGVTENEMRSLVREINGTIVAGPSDIGRYTIRLDAGVTNGESLRHVIERMQLDRRVRFAGRAFPQAAKP